MKRVAWTSFRGLLLFSGASLAVYVGYRYGWAGAPEMGTVYGSIFPAAILLAAVAILLALRPFVLRGVVGVPATAVRAGLIAFGAVWMGTGLLCVASLTQGVLASPFSGTLDFLHMITHHVVIPVSVAALALAGDAAEDWLGDGPATDPARSGTSHGTTAPRGEVAR